MSAKIVLNGLERTSDRVRKTCFPLARRHSGWDRRGELGTLPHHLIVHEARRRVTDAEHVERGSSKHAKLFTGRFGESVQRGRGNVRSRLNRIGATSGW